MTRFRRSSKWLCVRSAVLAAGMLASAQEVRADPFAGYYWNVFNIEGESSLSAQIVTYASPADMFLDANRIGVYTPNTSGFGHNIVGSGADGQTYWNVFNIEGESSMTAQFVTYASRSDMLLDTNRTGLFTPIASSFRRNIIGSASDGQAYWNVFNVEEESSLSAQIVTYASLNDMLLDTNRTGVFTPNSSGFGRNIVGSGSDGRSYWNVFNIEGESSMTAQYVTYSSLADMLLDTNRTALWTPNFSSYRRNIVGSGADVLPPPTSTVPEPMSVILLGTGLAGVAGVMRLKRPKRDRVEA